MTGDLYDDRFPSIMFTFHLRKRVLILFGFRSIFISLPLSTVCEEREFNFLTVRLMLDVLSKYMYSYSLYVTSKALVSGILSLAVPNLEGKVQVAIGRVCKINSHIRGNLYCGEVQ